MSAGTDVVITPAPPRVQSGTRRRAWNRFPLSYLLSLGILALVISWALFPSVFGGDPFEGDPTASFVPPGIDHWFGTDRIGRDLYARVVHGTSTTLLATLVAVSIAFFFGVILGLISAVFGGLVDAVVMRVVDVFLSVPALLFTMVIVAMLGYGTVNIAIAVGLTSIAAFARVMRAQTIQVVNSDYVKAGRGLGTSRVKVVLTHVLPNSLTSVLALIPLEFGSAVLAVASLGFLGYGAPPPQPEWGLLVAEGRNFLSTYPWVALCPGIVIATTVLATYRISVFIRK